jgi:hypothetical protein
MTVREELISELDAAPDEVVRALLTLLRSNLSAPAKITSNLGETPSFFDVAQSSIGAGEGPGDLSTNPDYMQGYGQ